MQLICPNLLQAQLPNKSSSPIDQVSQRVFVLPVFVMLSLFLFVVTSIPQSGEQESWLQMSHVIIGAEKLNRVTCKVVLSLGPSLTL